MRKIVSKVWMWLLLIWPNLFLIWLKLENDPNFNIVISDWIIELYKTLALVIFIANVVNVFMSENTGDIATKWSFWNMLYKIVYVPFFVVMTAVCMVGFFGVVMLPMCFFITIPTTMIMVIICFVMGCIVLFVPSLYGVRAFWTARKEGLLSTVETVILSIFSFLFVTDVICAIVGYMKIRKNKKMKNIEKSC